MSKDIAFALFQKVVDVIKAKEAVEKAQKEAEKEGKEEVKTETTNVETEVQDGGKQS